MTTLSCRHRCGAHPLRQALGLLCVALPGAAALAQTLPDVTVSASPLGGTELEAAQPTTVLRGAALDRARDTTLGESLSGIPGVHSSGFGMAAGRPIIRGLDGPRVRVTDNGLDALDVSTLSPDHAISIDPLQARSIEVLRGPATLLYGGGAIGGLVNVVSDLIPTTRLSGVRGQALLSGDSASRGHQSAFGLRGGTQGWNWTASLFDRAGGDYRFPGHAVVGDPASAAGRLPNSYTRADGFSTGGSYVGTWGMAGLGYSELNNRYGIPSEPDVFIQLRQRRLQAQAEFDRPLPGISQIRMKWAQNHYGHDEVDAPTGAIGTSLRNRGHDGRIEFVHDPVLGWRGALGVQFRARSLASSGAEAYIPTTREAGNGLFWVGERKLGDLRLELGARHEQASLRPDAASGQPARHYTLNSASFGIHVPVASGYAMTASLSSAQRAPVIEELYANGPHAATATYEIGDPSLARERSINLDLALKKTSGPVQWKFGGYVNRFTNYLYGRTTDENADGVPDRVDDANVVRNSPGAAQAGEFTRLAYSHATALFRGVEAELTWRPQGQPVGVRVFGDAARGTLTGAGNVPRMAPTRAGAAVDYQQGPIGGYFSFTAVSRQSRIATLETATKGYVRLDAELNYTLRKGADTTVVFFLQGRNLLDDEIRLHTSFIKDVVPMPGRSFLAGVRARF